MIPETYNFATFKVTHTLFNFEDNDLLINH